MDMFTDPLGHQGRTRAGHEREMQREKREIGLRANGTTDCAFAVVIRGLVWIADSKVLPRQSMERIDVGGDGVIGGLECDGCIKKGSDKRVHWRRRW